MCQQYKKEICREYGMRHHQGATLNMQINEKGSFYGAFDFTVTSF
jgi:hypothetical protein